MSAIKALASETEAAKILRAQFADLINGEEDVAADIIEGETNLNEAIGLVVDQIVEDLAKIDGLTAYVEKFTERRNRLKDRVATMKTAVHVALEQSGKKKHEHPAVTLSIRAVAPSVTVTDEAAIPSKFWVASAPKLDKAALKEALKAKEDIPGATLGNGSTTIAFTWK